LIVTIVFWLFIAAMKWVTTVNPISPVYLILLCKLALIIASSYLYLIHLSFVSLILSVIWGSVLPECIATWTNSFKIVFFSIFGFILP